MTVAPMTADMEQSRSPPFSPQHNSSRRSLGRDSSTDQDLSLLTEVLGSLPTIMRTQRHQVLLVEQHIDEFLKRDLDLSRLNSIHGYLWMAGRPFNARPLQRQHMMGFKIIPTDQMDLHLLKVSHELFVKPLPHYILSYDFWKTYLCGTRESHESASGLLLSYIWLICSPLDLDMARDHHLLPAHVTWPWWKAFVTDVYSHIDVDVLDRVNKRFHFGELRLGRVNSIYRTRFFFTHFIRGYLYGYNRYVVFFERKFAWVLVVSIYFTLVLSAMQVGSILPSLNSNESFQRATYGFVIFSIFIVVFCLGLVGVLFASIFFFNMVAAIMHSRRDRLGRQRLARERKITE